MRIPFVAAFLCLAGCVAGYPPAKPEKRPVFDPIAFFTGPSEGHGSLKILLRSPQSFVVRSEGRVEPDGSLVLDQRIARPDRRSRTRSWHIRHVGEGYAASLSSAEGPVAVAVEGNLLRLDFREDGLRVHQEILLASDGQSALNRMTLSKLGLRVAAAEERINRRGEASR